MALADNIPEVCQTGKVHSLKINVDKKNSWRSTGDHKVGQFVLISNNLNVKFERVN